MANSTSTQATASPSAGNKMQWLDALNRADVSHATFRVAYTIAMHADWDGTGPNGWSCYPSIKTIAQEAGCTRKTVSACLSTLTDHGWLSVQSGGFIDGRNVSNQYSLTIGGSVPKTLGVASSGRPGCSPEDALPTSSTNSNNQLHSGTAASDAPTSHADDSDLTVATTHSAVPPQGHGEVDPSRLNGWELLHYRWGTNAAAIVDETQRSAGGYMTDELCSLLTDADEDFYLWCADYGPRITHAAGQSRTKTIGVLARKLRTYMRDEVVELAPAA